jgi:hypothetical protein
MSSIMNRLLADVREQRIDELIEILAAIKPQADSGEGNFAWLRR